MLGVAPQQTISSNSLNALITPPRALGANPSSSHGGGWAVNFR
jgi:hypothetical protein